MDGKSIVERAAHAWNERDRDALLAVYAEDCELTTPDHGAEKGHAAVGRFYDESASAFPDNRIDLRTLVAEGDVVVEEGALVGTNTGPLPMPDGTDLPATGAPLDVPYVAVHALRGGLIGESRFYWDQVAMLGQLGLLPPQ